MNRGKSFGWLWIKKGNFEYNYRGEGIRNAVWSFFSFITGSNQKLLASNLTIDIDGLYREKYGVYFLIGAFS